MSLTRIVLAERPTATPDLSHFRLETAPLPVPAEGEFLARSIWLSLACSYPQVSGGGFAMRAPSRRSARREKPRQMTVVPGGASEARSR